MHLFKQIVYLFDLQLKASLNPDIRAAMAKIQTWVVRLERVMLWPIAQMTFGGLYQPFKRPVLRIVWESLRGILL